MTDNIQERFEEELHDKVFIWLDQENPTAQGFNVFWNDNHKAIEIQVVDALGGMAPDFLCQVFNEKLSIMYDVPQELRNSITEFYDKYVFEKETKKDLQTKMTPKEALKPIKGIVRLFTKKAEIGNFDDEFNLIEQAINELESKSERLTKVEELNKLNERHIELLKSYMALFFLEEPACKEEYETHVRALETNEELIKNVKKALGELE